MQAAFTNQATVFVSVRGVWYGVTCLDARVELKWLKSSQPYLEHRHRQKHPKEIQSEDIPHQMPTIPGIASADGLLHNSYAEFSKNRSHYLKSLRRGRA